jgi:hypothetical protein
MKKIYKQNKLIAEFMGLEVIGITEYTEQLRGMHKDGIYFETKKKVIEDLNYHSDWNQLIPVMKKCTEIWESNYERFSITFKNKGISNAWRELNITKLHSEIAKLIEFYKINNLSWDK